MAKVKKKPAIQIEEVPQSTDQAVGEVEKQMSYVPAMVCDLTHQAYMYGFDLGKPISFILKDGKVSIRGTEAKKARCQRTKPS